MWIHVIQGMMHAGFHLLAVASERCEHIHNKTLIASCFPRPSAPCITEFSYDSLSCPVYLSAVKLQGFTALVAARTVAFRVAISTSDMLSRGARELRSKRQHVSARGTCGVL